MESGVLIDSIRCAMESSLRKHNNNLRTYPNFKDCSNSCVISSSTGLPAGESTVTALMDHTWLGCGSRAQILRVTRHDSWQMSTTTLNFASEQDSPMKNLIRR